MMTEGNGGTTQHDCLNQKCIGIRIFERVLTGANGDLIELYRCTKCQAVSYEKARTLTDMYSDEILSLPKDDADTEPMPALKDGRS